MKIVNQEQVDNAEAYGDKAGQIAGKLLYEFPSYGNMFLMLLFVLTLLFAFYQFTRILNSPEPNDKKSE